MLDISGSEAQPNRKRWKEEQQELGRQQPARTSFSGAHSTSLQSESSCAGAGGGDEGDGDDEALHASRKGLLLLLTPPMMPPRTRLAWGLLLRKMQPLAESIDCAGQAISPSSFGRDTAAAAGQNKRRRRTPARESSRGSSCSLPLCFCQINIFAAAGASVRYLWTSVRPRCRAGRCRASRLQRWAWPVQRTRRRPMALDFLRSHTHHINNPLFLLTEKRRTTETLRQIAASSYRTAATYSSEQSSWRLEGAALSLNK